MSKLKYAARFRLELELNKQLRKRLKRTHDLLIDALDFFEDRHLQEKLGKLPSNTIGMQFWCIAGARNSYLNAAIVGDWQGFECPLTKEHIAVRGEIKGYLTMTFEKLDEFLKNTDPLLDNQENYLFDLLEHEIQHHGQLIRYMYGLKLGVPSSWKARYNLD